MDGSDLQELRQLIESRGAGALTVDELGEGELDAIAWSGPPTHLRSVAEALARGPEQVCYLVVRAPDGRPVCKGGIDFTAHAGAGTVWQLATMQPLWSLGLATRLLEEAERRIRDRGLEWAVLGVDDNDPKARTLYERLGYVAYGSEEAAWDSEGPDGTISRYETTVTLLRKRVRT